MTHENRNDCMNEEKTTEPTNTVSKSTIILLLIHPGLHVNTINKSPGYNE